MLSAIVIVGPDPREEGRSREENSSQTAAQPQRGTPLVCVEVLGQSVVERLAEELWCSGVGVISVLGDVSGCAFSADSAVTATQTSSIEEAWTSATRQLARDRDNGAELVVILRVGPYVDWDFRDAIQSHREQAPTEQRQAVTRAFGQDGPLDLWIVDAAAMCDDANLLATLEAAQCARYVVRGYVNRLFDPADLRRLAVDGLTSRCRLRPRGAEPRPGVWMGEGSQVHKDARIVAPTFIGRGTRIAEQCLITRCSNVESNCQIDYGTVLEDSSILPNSYVGIGLDVAHSIVDGTNLLNLERGVTLEIADPCVIRQNKIPHQDRTLQSPVPFGVGRAQLISADGGSR